MKDILNALKVILPGSPMEHKYYLLLGLLAALLCSLNFLTPKMVDYHLYGLVTIATIGSLFYCVTFPITDLLSECYGRAKALKAVFIMLLAQGLVIGMIVIAVKFPDSGVNTPAFNTMYGAMFLGSMGIMLGSFLDVIVVQLFDVYAFGFWKRVTRGRWLWFRNNGSTLLSVFIDQCLFTYLGLFLFTNIGQATAELIGISSTAMYWDIVVAGYILKATIAFLDTPFIYLGRKWIRASLDFKPDETWKRPIGLLKF